MFRRRRLAGGGQLNDALSAATTKAGSSVTFMVFFAIWWAWVNFTWFASAYDVDDVPIGS